MRASLDSDVPPVAFSDSNSPSSTLIVVWNDERIDPLALPQFQRPSSRRSPGSRTTMDEISTPKYAPSATVRPLMHFSTSPSQ
ncbi:hypothetical protein BQ8482_30049 [Mesorhizobium delmotii]|uniref:Uncharacterized protein n=1 Tax=Mesorhizobium delmotii TaxID=1631247 RepID=A0A2P9AN67_9HYPH|nr:hypothetical protein BQ8482_30049 [Mesorhizobium delmotii]